MQFPQGKRSFLQLIGSMNIEEGMLDSLNESFSKEKIGLTKYEIVTLEACKNTLMTDVIDIKNMKNSQFYEFTKPGEKLPDFIFQGQKPFGEETGRRAHIFDPSELLRKKKPSIVFSLEFYSGQAKKDCLQAQKRFEKEIEEGEKKATGQNIPEGNILLMNFLKFKETLTKEKKQEISK